MKHHFELSTARLFHHRRPAIIPGMHINAGNKALATALWKRLHDTWMIYRDINRLVDIAMWFRDRYPGRDESCIIPVIAHFQTLMGIDADSDLEYSQILKQLEPEQEPIKAAS